MAQSFTYNDINGLYKNNLGRDASQDEFANWQNGSYGDNPFSQIPQSGEAQAYKANQPNANATNTGLTAAGSAWQERVPGASMLGTNTPAAAPAASGGNATQQWLSGFAGKQGINESVGRDPGYWERRINETGGLRDDNKSYWEGLMRRPEGAPEGGSMQGGSWVGSPGGGGSMSSYTSGAGVDPSKGNALYDLLMQRATQGTNLDPNDPNIKSQTARYAADQTRGQREALAQMAEKAGPNSNLTAETRHAGEVAGQNTGLFEGQLMQNELSARRQEIQSALSGAQGLITSQQALALQEELAKLQLAENHYQFDSGQSALESRYGRDLGQRAYEFDATDAYRNSPLAS